MTLDELIARLIEAKQFVRGYRQVQVVVFPSSAPSESFDADVTEVFSLNTHGRLVIEVERRDIDKS
jgi:hypothetical protein